MAKAKLKTSENNASVKDFLNSVEDIQRKQDAKAALQIMKNITGVKPKMWGGTIVGFGKYHYKYDSGREGEMLKTGFSPRKNALTFYVSSGINKRPELLERLGKYKTGKSCLYIKKLEDIDLEILQEIIKADWEYMNERYG